MSSMPVSNRTRFSFAHPVLVAGLLLLAVPFSGFAQQRIIVNPTFVQRFQRDGGGALPDYSATPFPGNFCIAGSCFRYLGDANCVKPSGIPVDTQGCIVGWITTDPYDAYNRTDLQDGYISEPIQIGIGPNVEGLYVPSGAAELNAENAGRLYQKVCLAGGEKIPFSYSLGDPVSTGANDSQARFGVFLNNTAYPGAPADGLNPPFSTAVVNSLIVSTQTMEKQEGNVYAPAAGGLYQIGFEAVQPPSGAFGNYIANLSITLQPLVDFAVPSVPITITEGQSSFLLAKPPASNRQGGRSSVVTG